MWREKHLDQLHNRVSLVHFNVDMKFDGFVDCMKKAYLQFFPEKTAVLRHIEPTVNWYNGGLRQMREHLQLLADVAKQYNTVGNGEIYKLVYRKFIIQN